MSEHTKGAWQAGWTGTNRGGRWHVHDGDGRVVAEPSSAWDPDTVQANARLIAAAPDLLAVAETFLAHLEMGAVELHRDDSPRVTDACRAAIAKARGLSPEQHVP